MSLVAKNPHQVTSTKKVHQPLLTKKISQTSLNKKGSQQSLNKMGSQQSLHKMTPHPPPTKIVPQTSKNSKANIGWQNISVTTKTTRSLWCRKVSQTTQVLTDASGKVKSGELLAVMGPSGSGKTTLLNVLTGRNLMGYEITGSVTINGQPSSIEAVKSLSGYVQQGDMFIPLLTVREYLIFQSIVRMDNKISKEEREKRIEHVIEELGLSKCADSQIGNRYDDIVGSGISGGEIKRLSFAAELLTDPPILFCDEPTSGLDSYFAESVVKILRSLAESGRTVICTIHQPSSEVFYLFQSILLLTEGRTVFIGSLDQARQHFSANHLEVPLNYNPADYYLKQISIIPGAEEECRAKVDVILKRV